MDGIKKIGNWKFHWIAQNVLKYFENVMVYL